MKILATMLFIGASPLILIIFLADKVWRIEIENK